MKWCPELVKIRAVKKIGERETKWLRSQRIPLPCYGRLKDPVKILGNRTSVARPVVTWTVKPDLWSPIEADRY
jgi:hypothetical protein